MNKYINKYTLAPTIFGMLVLLLWKSLYNSSCFSLIFPIIIVLILTKSFTDYSIKRKECFAKCHFFEGTIIYNLVTSKYLIVFIAFFISLILGTFLAIDIASLSDNIFFLLFVDVFFIVWLYIKIYDAGASYIKSEVRNSVTKRICTIINSILISLIMIIIQIKSDLPQYIDTTSIQFTIEQASNLIRSDCQIINFILKLEAEIDALLWWLMIAISTNIEKSNIKLFIWIFFLIFNGLSIFAFSKFFLQIIDFFNILKMKDKENE